MKTIYKDINWKTIKLWDKLRRQQWAWLKEDIIYTAEWVVSLEEYPDWEWWSTGNHYGFVVHSILRHYGGNRVVDWKNIPYNSIENTFTLADICYTNQDGKILSEVSII